MSLTEGSVVGSYRILGKLGEGGMGTVYRAVDTMIQREVAIKALRPEIAAQPDVLERFRSEAVLLAKLNHSSIAQLYAFFSEGGQFYMVMEFVAGDTFERVIQQQGSMEWHRALAHMVQILDGIGHAHAAGILHRDLKPANVMLTPAGRIKLMDFGIAQALGGARMTRQGRIIGTLEYLAPERIQGKPADARSDLYSVGVMLFEMLSGRLPFQSDSEYELLQQQIQQPPPALKGLGVNVPAEVEDGMRKALEKDPAKRYTDADEFASAISALLPVRKTESKPIVVPVPLPGPPPAEKTSLTAKPVFWLASAGGLVVLALGIVFATMRSGPARPVTIADNGQPGIYQPPPATPPLVVNTTPVVIDQPKATPAPKTVPQPVPEPTPKPVRPAAKEVRVTPPAPVQTAPAPVEPPPAPIETPTAPVERPTVPRAAMTNAILRLSDARSIYVAGGQGELDGYIREEIQRQMGVRLRIAPSMHDADVIMRITLEEQRGGKGIASAGRVLGVKDHVTVRAVVVDAHTNRIIWQQGAGDRKAILGAFHGDPMKRVAERIVKELRDAHGH